MAVWEEGQGVGFFDFSPSNFMNSNTIQLDGCLITRNGVFDPTDATISPNIDHTDIASVWRNNTGIENTFIGPNGRRIVHRGHQIFNVRRIPNQNPQ